MSRRGIKFDGVLIAKEEEMQKIYPFKDLPRGIQAALANLVLFYSPKEWSHERINVEGVEGNCGVKDVFLQIEVYDLKLPDRPMPENLQRLLFGEAPQPAKRESIDGDASVPDGAGNEKPVSDLRVVEGLPAIDDAPVA
jgi:hypothetical protein